MMYTINLICTSVGSEIEARRRRSTTRHGKQTVIVAPLSSTVGQRFLSHVHFSRQNGMRVSDDLIGKCDSIDFFRIPSHSHYAVCYG